MVLGFPPGPLMAASTHTSQALDHRHGAAGPGQGRGAGTSSPLTYEQRIIELRGTLWVTEDIALCRAETAVWPGAGGMRVWRLTQTDWVRTQNACRLRDDQPVPIQEARGCATRLFGSPGAVATYRLGCRGQRGSACRELSRNGTKVQQVMILERATVASRPDYDGGRGPLAPHGAGVGMRGGRIRTESLC
jgi:hypothetical protein